MFVRNCMALELRLALIKPGFDSQTVFGKCVLVQGTKSADLMRALQGSMVNWAQSGPTVRLLLISFFPLLIGWFQVDQILHTINNIYSYFQRLRRDPIESKR